MEGILTSLANCLNSLEYHTPDTFDNKEHEKQWNKSIQEYRNVIDNPIVYLLTIRHRHGVDTTVHDNETSANKTLDQYCRDWWYEVSDQPYPEDGTGIDQYFSEENNFSESYDITTTPIQS